MDALCAAADLAAAGERNAEQGAAWYNTGTGGAFAGLLARRNQQINAVSPDQGTAQQGGGLTRQEGAGSENAQGEQREGTGREGNEAGGLFNIGAGAPHTPMADGPRQKGGDNQGGAAQPRRVAGPYQSGGWAALRKKAQYLI